MFWPSESGSVSVSGSKEKSKGESYGTFPNSFDTDTDPDKTIIMVNNYQCKM